MKLDRHTRLVGWLKVLLPMAALILLSSLFLISRTIDPSDAIPYADVDVEDRARTPRMTLPTYAGTTSDGGTVTLTAAEARPGAEQGDGTAQSVRAQMTTPDGARTDLTAAAVAITSADQRLRLSGGVTVASSTGYRLESETLILGLDRSGAQSEGAVTAEGPAGRIDAGRMEIAADPEHPGAYLLVFKQGVRLLYQP